MRSDRRWGTAALLFLLALTLLKGIRMPNRWAVTHYLFTYQTGFMKRGLWGELLSRLLGSATSKYFCLAAIGLLVLAGVIALLVVASRRLAGDPDRVALLLVLFASPALTFAAHLVGYLEQIVYLALLGVLVQRRRWKAHTASALLLAALAPLVHEAAVFWIGGLSGLIVMAGPLARQQPATARFRALALVSAVWVASTTGVSILGQVSAERAASIRESRTAFFDIRPRQDAFATLTVPLRASIADMRVRWADHDVQMDMAISLAVFAPAAVFLTVLAVRRARSIDADWPVRLATIALVAAAALGPLLLHFVGWDRHRWNALAALNAGLGALTLMMRQSESAETAGGRAPGWLAATPVALAVCFWSLAADPVFFDNYGPAHPPFFPQVQFLIEAIQTRDPNMWIPLPGN